MAHLREQLNIRVDTELKINAENVLKDLGIKTADAIRMFLTQVYLTKSFPIELKIPNKKTVEAINEVERGETTKTNITDLKNMFESL